MGCLSPDFFLLQVLADMRFVVEPVWTWAITIVVAVGLLATVLVTYRRALASQPSARQRALISLRLATALVLIWAMFRPVVVYTEVKPDEAQLFVLVDNSRSMSTKDMPSQKTRIEAVAQKLVELSPQWKLFSERLQLRILPFGKELHVDQPIDANQPANLKATEPESAYGAALETVQRESRTRRALGVIVMGDGAERDLPPQLANPRQLARQLGQAQVPIYTCGFGATTLSGNSLDLAIDNLLVDSVVFERKVVPISAKVRVLGAVGKKVQVRVLLEERSKQGLLSTGELKPVPSASSYRAVVELTPNKDSEIVPVELGFIPTLAGELKVAVEVVPIDGELLTTNNKVETVITVRAGGLSVAYFDRARWEQKFLKMVNSSDKIQLDYQEVRSGRFQDQTKIANSWFAPGKYNVFVIGDVPASAFAAGSLDQLVRRVEDGAGLLMLGGANTFAAGGYGRTALATVIPTAFDAQAEAEVQNGRGNVTDQLPIRPTDVGLRRYVMQIDTAENNLARWGQLPPLEGATRLRPKTELVEVLATSPDGLPLVLASEVGRTRAMAFAGDTTYLWPLAGESKAHQRFWRQSILWLAHRDADNDAPVWVRVEPRNYAPNASVRIEYGARNDKGEPLRAALFKAEVIGPDGTATPLTDRALNGEHLAEFTRTDKAGDYWVRVTASDGGNSLGFEGVTRFIVDPKDIELDNPSADYEMLKEISQLSGGEFVTNEDLAGLLDRLAKTELGDLEQSRQVRLWDNAWLLLVFITLQSLEWSLRKRYQLA